MMSALLYSISKEAAAFMDGLKSGRAVQGKDIS